ncbi:MAG TPA: SDR family NAD(P)-dependent oxidoreductase [Alphaproteobacteria bacterium]|nr:SDR family NAD(P)-dependent oxidoreductase [Alphaproteobacteria bacterium]
MKVEQIFDVAGHVAFVTGAANGIGLAMAEVMAMNGATAVMADIDPDKLETEVARLRGEGYAAEPVVLDVADLDGLRAAIDGAAARHGRLDAAFANAGISAGPGHNTPQGKLEAIDLAAWQRVVHINLTSVMVTMQAAAIHMKKQNSGRIVVTSSIAGIGAEDIVGYGYVATKAAIANMVRQAGRELAPYNISVNAIAPGPFRTNIGGGRINDPEVAAAFIEMVPAGRIAETDEMKGLILLLASPAASYLTGTVIPIDGGATA